MRFLLLLFLVACTPVLPHVLTEVSDSANASSNESLGVVRFMTEERALEVATAVVLSGPTYVFDGASLAHTGTYPARCAGCYIVYFEFVSAHGGYGDRSGESLLLVPTVHRASVLVGDDGVQSVVFDGVWDELTQTRIKEKTTLE